ncbi:MAG: SMP-30/gluconolactonase/LRE family protein [Chloroflexi bacterium]|nr:SMP-30/gluconolactonase/LRE family protein [Chloroflexota bacterium]
MSVEIRDERFREVVGDDALFEQLGTGFDFTEGAIWNHEGGFLIFSDMPGNVMRKWTPEGGPTGRIEVFRQPSNMANGNYYDPQGRLITCEHATSRLVRAEPDGSITVLASHYEGKELNSPNDVVVRSDGTIYFTDPIFGRVEFYGIPREQELSHQGVYRVNPDGSDLTLLVSDFEQPNGLTFSLDESRLFVNDTPKSHIRVFDVEPNGNLSNSRVWAEVTGEGDGVPDGLKIDSAGNVYTTGPGGIHVFAPDATCLGVMHVPEVLANFNWGGDDFRTLFATASTSLYRTRVKVAGNRAFQTDKKDRY